MIFAVKKTLFKTVATKDKVMYIISYFAGFLCAIHDLNEFIYDTFNLKMRFVFKMVVNIEINIDR